jgi:hypothetical protein
MKKKKIKKRNRRRNRKKELNKFNKKPPESNQCILKKLRRMKS